MEIKLSLSPLTLIEWASVVRTLKLSMQQARVADLILRGLKDKQIAIQLGISFSTVRTYLDRIFIRLSVGDRVGLVLRIFAARDAAAAGCP